LFGLVAPSWVMGAVRLVLPVVVWQLDADIIDLLYFFFVFF
jgi:hypothetical protein